MTKNELVARIAKDAGISRKAADLALKALVGTIQEVLKSAESSVRIPDLGTFKVSQRKARTGVNPRTRQKIQIPAATVPGFTAAKALKNVVKG